MGFDLESKSDGLRVSNMGWAEMLGIAELYGWKPLGTSPPKGVKRAVWDGGYHTNDGQLITAPDAQSLASALEDALKDDFQRIPVQAKSPSKPVTQSQRQEALEKLSELASGVNFEIVSSDDDGPPRPKGKRKPRAGSEAGSMEELLASRGLSMEDVGGLLNMLQGAPEGAPAPDPWYANEEGREMIQDFAHFCGGGEFRIF